MGKIVDDLFTGSFLPVFVGRISVGCSRILKLWEKKRGAFWAWMLIIRVVIVQNRNLTFIVKEACIIRLFATTKRISEAKLRLLMVLTNYVSSFSSILSPTAEILLGNALNKQEFLFENLSSCYSFVWSRFTKNLRDSRVKNILQLAPMQIFFRERTKALFSGPRP